MWWHVPPLHTVDTLFVGFFSSSFYVLKAAKLGGDDSSFSGAAAAYACRIRHTHIRVWMIHYTCTRLVQCEIYLCVHGVFFRRSVRPCGAGSYPGDETSRRYVARPCASVGGWWDNRTRTREISRRVNENRGRGRRAVTPCCYRGRPDRRNRGRIRERDGADLLVERRRHFA